MTNYEAVYLFHRMHNETVGGASQTVAAAHARDAADYWRRKHRDVADRPFRGRIEEAR